MKNRTEDRLSHSRQVFNACTSVGIKRKGMCICQYAQRALDNNRPHSHIRELSIGNDWGLDDEDCTPLYRRPEQKYLLFETTDKPYHLV